MVAEAGEEGVCESRRRNGLFVPSSIEGDGRRPDILKLGEGTHTLAFQDQETKIKDKDNSGAGYNAPGTRGCTSDIAGLQAYGCGLAEKWQATCWVVDPWVKGKEGEE